jgi:hypothetical protein
MPRMSSAPRVNVKKNKAVLTSTTTTVKKVYENQEGIAFFQITGVLSTQGIKKFPEPITHLRENPVLIWIKMQTGFGGIKRPLRLHHQSNSH